MSILFTARNIGGLTLPNRFVGTGCYECMAQEDGKVTDALIKRYVALSKGGVGLMVTGYMYVHQYGKANPFQTGIHDDSMIPGLARLARAVHDTGGRVAFQLVHAGRQTTREICGQTPMAPSRTLRDPLYLVKPRAMTGADVAEVIRCYGESAHRAALAGADAVHLSAAGGYLLNQFLSPFFNRRKDFWGGSEEGRFRFVKEVVMAVKSALPPSMPVIVKINANDHTPFGIRPALAARYARRLVEAGTDALEIASGVLTYSNMRMWRGGVPVAELAQSFPGRKRPLARLWLEALKGRYDMLEGWNLDGAAIIRKAVGDTPLVVVGGMRTLSAMKEAVSVGKADFIGLCRPLIRRPDQVNRFLSGADDVCACTSCNMCLAGLSNRFPVACYRKGLPEGNYRERVRT